MALALHFQLCASGPSASGAKFTSMPATGGEAPGEINIRSFGVTGNGATIDSAPIDAALAKNPNGKIYFPPGIYLLDNSVHAGLDGRTFSGSLRFATGAILKCTNVGKTSRACVQFVGGTGLVIDGLEVAYVPATPQMRAGATGAGLNLVNERRPRCSNIRIDGSSGPGVFLLLDVDAEFSNVIVKNTSADGFSSVNSTNTHLDNLTTDVTMDDALSVINYAAKPDNRGFVGNNIKITRGASRGVSVLGASDVQITNFSVSQTCAAGVFVVTDPSYNTRSPTNVRISQGTVTGAGRYTNVHYPCKNPAASGMGLQYSAAGSVTFDHIKISDTTAAAIAGNQGRTGASTDSAVLSNIDVVGPNVGGVTIYRTAHLEASKISLEKANGGFYISDNGEVRASELSAKNVKGFLHRSFTFESNDKVTGNHLTTTDDQDTPTGEKFYEDNTKQGASIKAVEAHIKNGKLDVHKAPETTLELDH